MTGEIFEADLELHLRPPIFESRLICVYSNLATWPKMSVFRKQFGPDTYCPKIKEELQSEFSNFSDGNSPFTLLSHFGAEYVGIAHDQFVKRVSKPGWV